MSRLRVNVGQAVEHWGVWGGEDRPCRGLPGVGLRDDRGAVGRGAGKAEALAARGKEASSQQPVSVPGAGEGVLFAKFARRER